MKRLDIFIVGLLAVAVVVFHGMTLQDKYTSVERNRSGNDFASYYYAVTVAKSGGDPYATRQLNQAAKRDGFRKGVHPFLYPPPFLLVMSWVDAFSLPDAYHLWFWLDALAMVVAMVTLLLWWRPLGTAVPVTLLVLLGFMTAIPNNHIMGQVNILVLCFVLLGLALEDRPLSAGLLVGTACMMKMAPALFVMWWMLRGKWQQAFAACGAAVLLSLATLPIVDASTQLRFFTEVLPEFASGRYNGLAVGIDLFGNHSIPNIWDSIWPHESGRHRQLSATARVAGSLTNLAVLGLMAWRFRGRDLNLEHIAPQVGAVAAAMLLVPVITYEHHLIWAIPAAVVAVWGVWTRRIPWYGALVVALALFVLCYDLQALKKLSLSSQGFERVFYRELKFVALLALWAVAWYLGGRKPDEGEAVHGA